MPKFTSLLPSVNSYTTTAVLGSRTVGNSQGHGVRSHPRISPITAAKLHQRSYLGIVHVILGPILQFKYETVIADPMIRVLVGHGLLDAPFISCALPRTRSRKFCFKTSVPAQRYLATCGHTLFGPIYFRTSSFPRILVWGG